MLGRRPLTPVSELQDRAFMTLMRLLPKAALSTAVGAATRAPLPRPVHQTAIRLFAQRYRVEMGEAEGKLEDYPTFAEFFTTGW